MMAVVQRYQRLRRIGHGAMGIVYEVADTITGHRLALKAIRSEDPDLLYALKQEFRRLARVSHPNLVRLHELGSDDQGCFFTMDLVEGRDFLNYCNDPSEDGVERELRIRSALAQVCQGLQAMHDAGLVHRDIKPGNVLVTREGRVVIVDFGLAAFTQHSLPQTITNAIAGTAGYMAPEQLLAEASVGPNADWYALGVMLFETLTGVRPFVGSDFEILRRKLEEDAPRLLDLCPDAPPDLDALCAELLSREPERRDGLCLRRAARGNTVPTAVSPRKAAHASPVDFAGRAEELAVLMQERAAVRAGACRVVLVRGESGIGKSALLRQFLEDCALESEHGVVLSGRCYQRESVPYKAVDALVDELSSYWKRLPRADAMYLLPREPEFLLKAFPVLGRVKVVTQMAAIPAREVAPQQALTRSLAACKETLQRLGRQAPLVLCLDDVHWMDQDSARLLRFLVESSDPPAALVLLGSRPIPASDPTNELLEPLLREARVIEVGPLSDQAMRLILRNAIGGGVSPDVDALVQEARGSPFFALTLVRHLDPQTERSGLDLDDVLAQQIDELPAEERTLLELAAVAGRPLSPALAARATGTDEHVLGARLLHLESLNLTRSGAGIYESHFESYHDRIREFVLRQLPPPRSCALHGELAAALEREPEPDSDACARHYKSAGDLERAAAHARVAAARAEKELSFVKAADHYRLCLEPTSLSQTDRAELRKKLADALCNAGRGAEAAEEYLLAAATAGPDERVLCESRAAEEFLRSGNPERGLEALRSVLAQVNLNYPTSTAWAVGSSLLRHRLTKLARLPKTLDDAALADAELLRKIDVCSSVAHCVGFLDPLMTSYYQGLHMQLALKARERSRLCRALAAEAIYASLPGGDSAHAQSMLKAAIDLGQTAEPRARAVAIYSGGVASFMQGRWASAREQCQEGERILKESCAGGVQWELDTTMLYILASHCAIGEFLEAEERTARHTDEARARKDSYALTILRAGSTHILRLARNDPHLALEELRSVMDAWPASPFSIPRYWELLCLTNTDLYMGEPERALSRFDDWGQRIANSLPFRVQVTRIRTRHARARAMLAVARRKPVRRELLLGAQHEIDALEAEQAPWASALASGLRATVAFLQQDSAACLSLLELAEQRLLATDLRLDAMVTRRRRGELIGGTEGAQLIAESTHWMTAQGIQDPNAFVRVYAPGFDGA